MLSCHGFYDWWYAGRAEADVYYGAVERVGPEKAGVCDSHQSPCNADGLDRIYCLGRYFAAMLGRHGERPMKGQPRKAWGRGRASGSV